MFALDIAGLKLECAMPNGPFVFERTPASGSAGQEAAVSQDDVS